LLEQHRNLENNQEEFVTKKKELESKVEKTGFSVGVWESWIKLPVWHPKNLTKKNLVVRTNPVVGSANVSNNLLCYFKYQSRDFYESQLGFVDKIIKE